MKTQGWQIRVANQMKMIFKTYFVQLVPLKHTGLNSAYAAQVSFGWTIFFPQWELRFCRFAGFFARFICWSVIIFK